MTRSVPGKTSCALLAALLSTASAGCGSAASAPEVDVAQSSVQRVIDPQVSDSDTTTLASDNDRERPVPRIRR